MLKRYCASSLMFALPLAAAFTAAAASPSVLATTNGRTYVAGLSKVDITPDYPVRLNGYLGRNVESTNAVGRLYAKALAIGSDREGPAILVSVDNCIVPRAVYEELVTRLKKKGVKREKFAMLVSHTHCAPKLAGAADNIYGMDIPPADQAHLDRYTKEFTDYVEKAALDALKDRHPAKLSWGHTSTDFAANRRTKGGPVDHDLPVLVVTEPDGKIRGIFVSYACHCTTLGGNETRMCADWAGFAQKSIEETFPGAIGMTGIGCGADQNPQPRSTVDIAEQHGREIAIAISNLLTQPLTPLNGKLECRADTFDLPLDTLPSREEFEKRAADTNNAHYPSIYHAKKELARLDRGEKLPTAIPYLAQEWNFGKDLLMTFLPGEVVVDYSLRQKREFDKARLWVNAYSDFVPCYIPSKRVWTEGGYEGGFAMIYYDVPTRLAESTEETIFKHLDSIAPKAFRTMETRK